MLLLLSIPTFKFVGFLHAVLQAWAPSNIFIRRVKAAPPRWRTTGGLVALSVALLFAVRALELAIAAGAPTWLWFPTGILAWDAIKIATLALACAGHRLRATGSTLKGTNKCSTACRSCGAASDV